MLTLENSRHSLKLVCSCSGTHCIVQEYVRVLENGWKHILQLLKTHINIQKQSNTTFTCWKHVEEHGKGRLQWNMSGYGRAWACTTENGQKRLGVSRFGGKQLEIAVFRLKCTVSSKMRGSNWMMGAGIENRCSSLKNDCRRVKVNDSGQKLLKQLGNGLSGWKWQLWLLWSRLLALFLVPVSQFLFILDIGSVKQCAGSSMSLGKCSKRQAGKNVC